MLEKKVRNKKRQFSFFNTVAKPSSDNEESDNSDEKDVNRKHFYLIHQGKSKSSKKS